jgi:hypothetical protein
VSVRNVSLWVILFLFLVGNFSTLVLMKFDILLTLENNLELIDENKSSQELDFEIKKICTINGIKIISDFSISALIKNFKRIPFYFSDHIIPLFSPPPNQ